MFVLFYVPASFAGNIQNTERIAIFDLVVKIILRNVKIDYSIRICLTGLHFFTDCLQPFLNLFFIAFSGEE